MFDDATRVLRIRYDDARDIDVQGRGGKTPPLYVTFDDPHLSGGTLLEGQYSSGIIDWDPDVWRINVPEGKFGTFNLALAYTKASAAEFHFYWPRVFAGMDVYNAGAAEATLTKLRTPRMCLRESANRRANAPTTHFVIIFSPLTDGNSLFERLKQ